ncbi:E3 ubiquitin ligase BIG BROTHER-related [Apostasia shenzhenica]|uniref:RING-type E3 ubiquitin transferase n=1 Tax=Apostasia shenzhenica TaxID=1088818 RepID=A0A2H9ZZP9_9ASPA|nr:E3 ubiquitin ligase BIG BROTHER-related [Apostasia shenzhenica]
MFDLESESSESCLLPACRFPESFADYANRYPHPVVSAPGNTTDLLHQFRDYQERVIFCGNQYNAIQNFHPISNLGLGGFAPNFYDANMLLTPAGRNFPVHQTNIITEQLPSFISQTDNVVNVDEFGRNNELVNSDRGSCKRKNLDAIPGFYYNLNGPASSSSSTYNSNCGLPLWGHFYESVPHAVDPTSRCPQYRGRAPLIGEGSHGSAQNRVVTSGFHQDLAFVPQQNCLFPGSHMNYPFPPTNRAFASYIGNGTSSEDGSSSLNYNNNLRHFQGRYTNRGPSQMTNINIMAYHDSSSGNNSAVLFHPPSISNFHSPLQNVQVHSHGHHVHMPTSYQHFVNNFISINANHSLHSLQAGSAIQNFPTGADQIYRPRQLPQSIQHFNSGSVRTLSSESGAGGKRGREGEMIKRGSGITEDGGGLVGVEGKLGKGEKMMEGKGREEKRNSGERELLALEEQIGVVKTGLAEECILEGLKTRIYVSQKAASTLGDWGSAKLSDNQTCTICQVEYAENESIGVLDCGHNYHVDCIKQWLLIKNLCPICKTSALPTKDKNID